MKSMLLVTLCLTSIAAAMDIQSPLIVEPDPEYGQQYQRQLLTFIKKVDRDGVTCLLERLKRQEPSYYDQLIEDKEVLDTARAMVNNPPVHIKELMTYCGYMCMSSIPIGMVIWSTVTENSNNSRHICREHIVNTSHNQDITQLCDSLDRSDYGLWISAATGTLCAIYNLSRMAIVCCKRPFSRTVKDSRIIFEELSRLHLEEKLLQDEHYEQY